MSTLMSALHKSMPVWLPVLLSVWGAYYVTGLRIKAEQERQELLLKQSLHRGILESLVLVHSRGTGAMFLLEAEKGFVHGTDSVVEALAGSRTKLMAYLEAKEEAEKAEKAEKDWEHAKAKEVKASEDWNNARIKLLYTLRKGLRPKTKKNEEWLKANWRALGVDCPTDVEKFLLQRQQ